ncbi:MAG: 30S ribosomal protein S12 methylthiotransferase RimO, partial [Candidatus Krumholzibacteria bacterium]|nr:30S ribosomal protein S12 methylthiotransferase RimO [Candidatus Krumholzibacteria bacterium]
AILGRMGRPYTRRDLVALFDRLRSSIDDLVLRTTVMTGFPGETKADHLELADFLEETSFDHVGVFAYSPEKGTRAERLAKKVPSRVALERSEELLDIQMDISQERLRERLGVEMNILVDARLDADERPGPNIGWVGRFFGQAYDVDGVTFLEGNAVAPGGFVRARIIETQAYDLIARVLR